MEGNGDRCINPGFDGRAAQLRDSDRRIEEIRFRIANLANDCGCRMGGVFFAAAVAMTVTYFLITGGLGLDSGLLAVGFVIVASWVGKLVGLSVARIRLLWLRRVLAARLAAVGVSHVHLH